MSKTILTLQTPFQNLKLITMINRIMGLLPCKLVNGRLKPSAWNRFYCGLWILIHCAYSGMFYYDMYIAFLEKEANKKMLIFDIVRFTVFIASLIPYNCVAAFQDQDFIKFSDKLETYDDKARALGYERKDKHKFIWLFFVLTTIDLIRKTYDSIDDSIPEGTTAIVKTIFEGVVPFVIGTYCVFITGIFLDLIGQRFHHLNETIIPHVSQLPITGSPGEITVYDVRYLHGMLLDSADQINRLFGIGIFFTSLSLLLEFVKNIYVLATKGIDDNEIITMLDLFFQAVYLYGMYHFVAYEMFSAIITFITILV
ncbi:uncharacterized protein LOC115237411 [Formica exsecta]|uniref:uncharacterized protein LOC115237411 n=1 Tax=Formica exsecta TaxID=72781 RepID=UPI0011425653|nr:uncharacterized protein LOC115237411 [Formica exsecta]